MSETDREERILDAAYACFTRHGIRRTTMDDIARAAEMSRPAVYQYVGNKEDAFRRLTARLLDQTLAAARAAAVPGAGLVEQLSGVLEAKLGLAQGLWADSPQHAAELLSVDPRHSADLIDAYNMAMRDLLTDTAAASLPSATAVEIAEMLLALTRGLEADLSDPEIPVRRLRRAVRLLVAGLNNHVTNNEENHDHRSTHHRNVVGHRPGHRAAPGRA